MNDNAKAWVAALRSGKFEQGRNLLHYIDGDDDVSRFCCLGVASELAYREGIIDRTGEGGGYRYGGDRTALVDDTRRWFGLISGGRGERSLVEDQLVGMNDRGVDFQVIANFIESEPKGLFA